MAIDPCQPCTCIPANVSQAQFNQSALVVLCGILEELETSSGTDVNIVSFGGTAVTLGQKAMAASMPVVFASDQSALSLTLGAGSAIIGKVGIDQTTPGTTNKVSIGNDGVVQLAAGTAIAGKFGIDQTTPGTTNLVSIGSNGSVTNLASSNIIGKVGIDQTTPGTTNKVSIGSDGTVTLLAGSAIAGKFGIDQTTPGTTNLVAVSSISTSIVPGVAATNLGKAEDAGHSTGDTGVAVWGVRDDAGTTNFSGTTLDYSPLSVNPSGHQRVNLMYDASVATTLTPVILEDVAVPAAGPLMMVGAQRQTTPSNDTGTTGDAAPFKGSDVGALYVEPANVVATYGGTTTSGAAGAVPTTGANVHTNAAKAKIITVRNKLDVDVQISLDAGTTYIAYVDANVGSIVLDLGASGRWTASNIFAKAIGSNSASGSIYIGTVV